MRKYKITNHATKKEIIVEANSAQEAAKKVGYRIKGSQVTDIGQPKLSGMPLSKAIEILDLNIKEAGKKMPPDCKDAVQLGIEAMKKEERLRELIGPEQIGLLPGETRES